MPFRASPAGVLFCPLRAGCPCAGTISALFVLPQVRSGRSHVGPSPADRGRRAGTPLRGYPSHVASLVGPFRSRGRGRPRRPPAPASPAPMPSGSTASLAPSCMCTCFWAVVRDYCTHTGEDSQNRWIAATCVHHFSHRSLFPCTHAVPRTATQCRRPTALTIVIPSGPDWASTRLRFSPFRPFSLPRRQKNRIAAPCRCQRGRPGRLNGSYSE